MCWLKNEEDHPQKKDGVLILVWAEETPQDKVERNGAECMKKHIQDLDADNGQRDRKEFADGMYRGYTAMPGEPINIQSLLVNELAITCVKASWYKRDNACARERASISAIGNILSRLRSL